MKKLLCYCFLLITSCSNQKLLKPTPKIFPNKIDIWELSYLQKTLYEERSLLIDLRPTEIYQQSHIERALSLPYKKILSITNIPNYTQQRIIFYDRREVNYSRIYKQLFQANITNFYLLKQGYVFWEKHTTNQ